MTTPTPPYSRIKRTDEMAAVLHGGNIQKQTAFDYPGLHFVGPFHEGQVNGVYWPHLRRMNYRWIVVLGAADINDQGRGPARDFAAGVANDPIRTKVVFRHWRGVHGSKSEDGRLGELTPDQWMQRVGVHHLGAPYWLMTDNEGVSPTIAKANAALIPMAKRDGLKLAVGAWSTHNPRREDWPLYLPMFEAMYQHPDVAVYAPHIYYSRRPSHTNYDGFVFVRDMLAYVEKVMGAPIPFETVITEYGRCQNKDGTWLDPNNGYGKEGLSQAAYADELLAVMQGAPDYHYVVFAYGAWGTDGSVGVWDEYRHRMEEHAAGIRPLPEPMGLNLPPVNIDDIPLPVTPQPPTVFQPARDAVLRIATHLRSLPQKAGVSRGVVAVDTPVIVREPAKPIKADEYTWVHVTVKETGVSGWMALHAPLDTLFTFAPPQPDPDPEPEPEPPTPPDSDTLIVDALTMQYRAFLLRGKIVRRQIELLDEEAQQLQANILQLANLLESLGVSVPEGT